MKASHFNRGDITSKQIVVNGNLPITEQLKLEYELPVSWQSSSNKNTVVNLPDTDLAGLATLRYRHAYGLTGFKLGYRSALDSFKSLALDHNFTLGPAAFHANLSDNMVATEGSLLRAGGMKDRALFDFNWSVDKRTYLAGDLEFNRFQGQDQEYLGSGRSANLTLGHRLRLDYPGVNIRLAGSWNHYTPTSMPITGKITRLVPGGGPTTATQFMPRDFQQYGLFFGIGEEAQNTYTRWPRPFLDLGVTHNSISGIGYRLGAGLATSVFGDDLLSISFTRIQGGGGRNELNQEVSLFYQLFY